MDTVTRNRFITVRTKASDTNGQVFVCQHLVDYHYEQYGSVSEQHAAEMIAALEALETLAVKLAKEEAK